MLYVVFMLGVIFGSIIMKFICKSTLVGSLHVDTSDPDGPYLFLELLHDIEPIIKARQVTFKVDTKNFPQK